MRVFFAALMLIMLSVQADELDPGYYPERLQWYALDDAFSLEQFYWQQGQYLRLSFNEKPAESAVVWLQGSKGLYQQIKPQQFEHDGEFIWLLKRNNGQNSHVILDNMADNYPSLIEWSHHKRPPKLKISAKTILHDDFQVSVNRSNGYVEQDFNRLEAGQTLTYELEGPGQFEFVWQTQWHSDYGQARLMELFIAKSDDPFNASVVKIQPQTEYELQTPWCECQYSRRLSQTIELGEGKQQVKVKADREIIGFWRKNNAEDAYLFSHNAHLDKMLQATIKTPQAQPPKLYFYRTLNGVNKAAVESLADLEGNLVSYMAVSPGQQNRFDIPTSSKNPPLRVLVSPQGKPLRFNLRSSSGETISLYYPAYDDELLQGRQYVQFTQPFDWVSVINQSTDTLKLNLSYKNISHYQSNEDNFLRLIDVKTATKALSLMMFSESLKLQSKLLNQEVMQWQQRLNARYHSFVARYPSEQIAGDLEAVKAKLSELTNTPVHTLEQLMLLMDKHGLAIPAKRWLAYTAMGPQSDLQKQAQQLFLQQLAQQERWFDIEGYWAHQLLARHSKAALVPLAQVLLRQNLFELSAKWFWLAEQNGLYTQAPIEGVMAAKSAGFEQLSQRWLDKEPELTFPWHWQYWQDVQVTAQADTTAHLLHNIGLDLYFQTTRLAQKQRHNLSLDGPARYKLTLYPVKPKSQLWQKAEQLQLSYDSQTQYFDLKKLNDTLALETAVTDNQVLASPKTVVFDVPPGKHQIGLLLQHHDGLFTIKKQTDLLADLKLKRGQTSLANTRLALTTPLDLNHLIEQSVLQQKDHQWRRLQSVVASGGFRTLQFDNWQGLSGRGKLQQALFVYDVDAGERLLSNRGAEVFNLQTQAERLLTIRVRDMPRFGYPQTPSKVILEYADQKRLLSLPVETSLPLPPGEHQIRLSLANEQGYRLGKAESEGGRAWAFFSVSGVELPAIKRTFHVSEQHKPLVVQVPDDSWIRIDRADGHSTVRYYQDATQIALKPTKGDHQSLYQVYRWQKTPRKPLSLAAAEAETAPFSLMPEVVYWPLPEDDAFVMLDRFDSDEQQDGTWGLSSGYRSRHNFDENEQTAKEEFYELGWRYRRNIPDWNSYIANDIYWRTHQGTGLETLVSKNYAVWQQDRFWQVFARLNLFHQYSAPRDEVAGANSIYAQVGVNWRQYWDDNIQNRVTLSAFNRYLSLSEAELYPGHNENEPNDVNEDGLSVDDDVYSDYKEDNPRGLRLSDVWQYQPYQDTRIRLGAAITSDKRLNLFNPQSLSLTAGIRQYYEPFVFRLDFRHIRFKRQRGDLDNTDVLKRNTLSAGLLFEHWRLFGQLAQVELFAASSLDSGRSSFGINFHWYFSEGQGYQDFAPSSLAFGGLRKRMGFHKIATNEVVNTVHE